MASENKAPETSQVSAASACGAPRDVVADVAMPFEPGLVIHGKYELLRPLGSGGVGFVVAARHIGFDDFVALKFLRPEFATHQEAVSRFTIEARASFKLRSEHVARMLDVDIYEGTPFIAMELLDGTDLRSLLETRRVLDLQPAVDYALQTCEALAAAHAIGVIHRDIKPENLFLLGDGQPTDHLKVLDFGISKVAVRGENRRTHQALTRMAVGTPPYMSPEQVRASSALDGRSDIWSLGCVLYEALTGTAPFDRVSLMQACAAVLEDEPTPPAELRADIPEDLCAVVMRCLCKDPNARFADVASLAEALCPFGSGRLSSYPARCKAHLAGEGLGRRSTPPSFANAQLGAEVRRATGLPPGAAPALGHGHGTGARSITVRLESHAPLTRRTSTTHTKPAPAAAGVSAAHAPAAAASAVPAGPSKPAKPAHPTPPKTPIAPASSVSAASPASLPAAERAGESEVSYRAPRRRAVQLAGWAAPIIVGGLLATYLATAEQRSRAAAGPSLHAVSPDQASPPADMETAAQLQPVQSEAEPDTPEPADTLPEIGDEPLKTAATAEELAQAAALATVDAAGASASGNSESRSNHAHTGEALHASASGGSSSKHGAAKSRPRTTRPPAVVVVKPTRASATDEASVAQHVADPDVGF